MFGYYLVESAEGGSLPGWVKGVLFVGAFILFFVIIVVLTSVIK
jgi:hypothetical protein